MPGTCGFFSPCETHQAAARLLAFSRASWSPLRSLCTEEHRHNGQNQDQGTEEGEDASILHDFPDPF